MRKPPWPRQPRRTGDRADAACSCAETPQRGRSAQSFTILSSLDKLMVCALGHVVPRPHQRLKLREGGVHLAGHGGLLRLLSHDLGRQLAEIPQYWPRKLDDLD